MSEPGDGIDADFERDASAAPAVPAPAARPASTRDLFWTFNRLALPGFGGVLAVAQRELVERKGWLTREEFVEMLALSQVLPGPNVVNLALMFGDRFFGMRGAAAAVGGMLVVPLVIVLSLTAAYAEFSRIAIVSGALRGMGAVAAGLIMSTAFKLMKTLGTNLLGLPLAIAFAAMTFIAIALLRWPLVWVIVGLGTSAFALAYARLK